MQSISKEFEKEKNQEFNKILFETEMSQDFHQEDKQFSPWIKKQGKKVEDADANKKKQHVFLQKINIKQKKPFSIDQNSEEKDKKSKQIAKQSLQIKINNDKIKHHREKLQIIRNNNLNKKAIEHKSYFKQKPKFNHFVNQPKCINLKLNLQENKHPRPFLSIPSPNSMFHESARKRETYSIIKKQKIKEKQQSNGEKQFAETMRNFHENMQMTQKKFYNTIQLNIFPYNPQKLKSNKEQRVQHTSLNIRNNKLEELQEKTKVDFPSSRISWEKKTNSPPFRYSRQQKLRKYFDNTEKEGIFVI